VDGAEAAAVGAADLRRQGLDLLLEEVGEGTLGQARSGSSGGLLHRPEVKRGIGAIGLRQPACHDFSPACGQFLDFLELFRREFVLRHEQSCLALASIPKELFPPSLLPHALCTAKCVMVSIGSEPVLDT
jgi:hypothetical protein